ncbi:HigA family addiction module antitoxin [Cyanobacterium sp. IPPAS B-1200]|uniref:HigA family addiction module antitoxin n=1 Tax=Cyanobacterium sp. IPPAS B-1200 TaxID=1562720 RepID=UPI000852733A|nr:HigA family addiction module antitoxin [Cyanobacterium sp. IPPAS B-1200]OEJ78496.1 transcriptional regulator [Cyanobacterium sp. IPPAS B-1200]
MIPTNRIPTHAGIILLEEFLEPMNITQVALARHLNIPVQRINEIIRGKRGITPETAWLLSQAFNTTPQFWMNLQTNYDLAVNKPKERKKALII